MCRGVGENGREFQRYRILKGVTETIAKIARISRIAGTGITEDRRDKSSRGPYQRLDLEARLRKYVSVLACVCSARVAETGRSDRRGLARGDSKKDSTRSRERSNDSRVGG